ncbi:MAG: Uma2 family endonuclease, partial [Chloroflexota bacterium]|nr:Uma2 family endonuclease [Chloroflexota bacterium]
HATYGKQFIVAADVGLFSAPTSPPIVPDFFLSLGVRVPEDRRPKRNRSYFIWEVGKPPEVVIEIVSNQEGQEAGTKLVKYAELGILYYAIFDPLYELSQATLRLFRLQDDHYVETSELWMPEVELGLTVWQGRHRDSTGPWLRWCDRNGNVIPTGAEGLQAERQRAEQERQRADRLAARLRQLGLEEDQVNSESSDVNQ